MVKLFSESVEERRLFEKKAAPKNLYHFLSMICFQAGSQKGRRNRPSCRQSRGTRSTGRHGRLMRHSAGRARRWSRHAWAW
ncbi:hypothetical protein CXP35_06305 [Komagataeibacter xylinus]|nr:hypothetical protein CXP35_06305 [Komagataeibacter xylinus]